MLIDWFTVGAQILNFLILVWLLKRFLYKPILNAIDAREQRIAAELADADAKQTEARKERDAFREKNEAFDRERAGLLSKVADEATAERERLLDDARQAADALSAKRQATLRTEAHNLNQAIAHRTQQEVFAIARKALADLATTSLEASLCDVFTRRLRALDGETKAGLAGALETASEPALVRSAFDLPEAQRAAIQQAIHETFPAAASTPPPPSPSGAGTATGAPGGGGIRVRFETAPELIGGIELSANGRKVAWSLADYIASMEAGVGALLKDTDKPVAKAESGTEATNRKQGGNDHSA